MYTRSQQLIRVTAATGLVATAIPLAHLPWASVQHAAAAPMEVRGYSHALLANAARQPARMIFLLRPDATGKAADVLRTLQRTGARNITALGLINGVAAEVSDSTLSALRYDPRLLAMTIDRPHSILPAPDYADLNAQVARATLAQAGGSPGTQQVVQQPDTLSIIHADTAQKQYNGRGVRVALIDSGIDYRHPDLQGVLLRDASGRPLIADFTGTDITDTVGHGTSCAGVIAAQARTVYSVSNVNRIRVYPLADPTQRFSDHTSFTVGGVAPGVKLMAAKIFDTRVFGGSAYDSAIVRGIQWAMANHADVISESFGATAVVNTNASTDVVALADEAAVHAGITVVAADGNSGPGQSSVSSPAQAPDVIAAGASTDYQLFGQIGRYANYGATVPDNLAAFTSRGPTYDGRIRPDVYAPGLSGWAPIPLNPSELQSTAVEGTRPRAIVGAFNGTSMATPVIAATASLVINAYMETHGGQRPSPQYVKQVLTSSADDLGYPAADQAAGRVNAQRAVDTVLHRGSSILLSGSLALRGKAGDVPTGTVTVTNSGATPERITFDPQVLQKEQQLKFSGTVIADNLYAYRFAVPTGVAKLTAAAFYDNLRSVPLPGQQGTPVALRVRLYDPRGNFVNYGFEGGGNTQTTAGKPAPGTWTAVVEQISKRDHQQVSHYVNVPFLGTITMERFHTRGATVTPGTLVLAPGQRSTAVVRPERLAQAGVRVLTLHVRERSLAPVAAGATATETTATIPVVVTTNVTLANGAGSFTGSFTGAGAAGGLDEVEYYNFTVPAGTKNMAVTVRWQHRGNWFLLALLDPEGRATNIAGNALPTNGPVDLSDRAIDEFITAPMAGHWQVELVNYIFAGTQPSEPYSGSIRLNQVPVTIDTDSVTMQAGGASKTFSMRVRNLGAGIQPYLTYATSDRYSYVPLGGTGGTLQNGPQGISSTQVLTYTTNFVPPGTREIVSQAQALNSNIPIAIELDDPVLGGFRKFSLPAPETLGGVLSQGTAAVVRDTELPIGPWSNQLALASSAHTGPVYVAASSIAYSLTPNPWVKIDAQLRSDGTLSGNSVPIAQAGGGAILHGTVSVPPDVAPGTYHSYIFVYKFGLFGFTKLAQLPLTIRVVGEVPAAVPTPDPLLAAIVTTQYFPEGATGTGLADRMDLVNPTAQDAHAQIKLLTFQGWTTLNRYDLKPHSRTTINMEPLVGKNQPIAAVVQGDRQIVSGRQIARNSAAGSYSIGTAAPATRWYFADGYTIDPFQEYLTVVNPNTHTAHIHVHLVSDQGDVRNVDLKLDPSARAALRVAQLLSGKAVSAAVTSDLPIVAERTELFGTQGQGVTTTVGSTGGATNGYIDTGHLPAGAQSHISLYNPQQKTAHVTLTLIDGAGRTAHSVAVTIKPDRRATVDLSARFGTANLGAQLTSDLPVVAEKVSYFGFFKSSRIGGSDLPLTAAPAARLVFPGGSTADGAADYLSLYNPGTAAATARLTLIYRGSSTAHRVVQVPAGRRVTLKINTLGLPAGASSIIVDAGSAQVFGTQTIMSVDKTDGSEVVGFAMNAS